MGGRVLRVVMLSKYKEKIKRLRRSIGNLKLGGIIINKVFMM
jgi:hypothetical protein